MDDLISRDDAIKAILNLTSCESVRELFEFTQNHELVNSWGGGISDAIDAVIGLPSAQPDLDEWCTDCKEYDSEKHCCPRWNRVIRNALKDARPEPRWIPVDGKERLPRDGQRVLVTDEDGEIDIAHIIDYSDIGEGIEWWAHDYKCYPIAWMPLPKAYERSEDGQ